ncbi:hypothetical protein [Streptococcus danieliae]|uniref:hypothetical protein n=1 Tax=Streptococcus danieliae TaxID=747656 RepID=UPI0021C8BD06|nr:hypothetical protein [Streptococcus danieliae]MCU0082234.1 hypothetical protein [Streptococcus danieliae]
MHDDKIIEIVDYLLSLDKVRSYSDAKRAAVQLMKLVSLEIDHRALEKPVDK